MKLVIIRHGQTRANVINNQGTAFYTGALNNELTDLTEAGERMAKELANKEIIKEIKKVYSSDLNRTIQTAKLVKPDLEINLDKNLRERCLGIFEGKEEKDLLSSKEYNKYILDEKYNKFRLDFVQKAPKGENYTDVSKRCKVFLDSIDLNEDTTIGVFSHINFIRCLFLNLLNIEPKEKIFKLKIANCVPYVIEGNKNEGFKLISHDLEELYSK